MSVCQNSLHDTCAHHHRYPENCVLDALLHCHLCQTVCARQFHLNEHGVCRHHRTLVLYAHAQNYLRCLCQMVCAQVVHYEVCLRYQNYVLVYLLYLLYLKVFFLLHQNHVLVYHRYLLLY